VPELREMIAADHVKVYRLALRNRRLSTSTKAIRRVQLVTPSTTTARLQQTAESSNGLKQSTGIVGFVDVAQNVKQSLNMENRLIDTHHQRPHKPLLFDGILLRSDTQQYAYNSRLTASDTGDGDSHQPHYAQVLKHSNYYSKSLDDGTSLLNGYTAAGDHYQTEVPPIQQGKTIGRRSRPIRKRSESNQRDAYTNRQSANDLQRVTMSKHRNSKHLPTLRSNREMLNLHGKIKTSGSSQTSVTMNNTNTGDSDVLISDKAKLPMESTAVRTTDILSVLDRTDVTSSNAVEKNVLLDVTNTPTSRDVDIKTSPRINGENFQVAGVLSSRIHRKISASMKGSNGVLTPIIPTAMLNDRIQCNQRRQGQVKRYGRQISQENETPTSGLRSTQQKGDFATKETSTSRQSSAEKCETTDNRQSVSKRPTLDKAEIKMQQLIISAEGPPDTEYTVVPDFRAHVCGTASTIKLHDDATAASTASAPLATASTTPRSPDSDPARTTATSPYKDNDFSKEKGDIDIGNKLPAESSSNSFIFH